MAAKIIAAKQAQRTGDFVVIARTETFISGGSLDEAINRCQVYEEAGADALVVHSKSAEPTEIARFCREYRGSLPLIAIPTTYYRTTAKELESYGISMVIFANHTMRSMISAASSTLASLRYHGSSAAMEDSIAPLADLLDLTRTQELIEDDREYLSAATELVEGLSAQSLVHG